MVVGLTAAERARRFLANHAKRNLSQRQTKTSELRWRIQDSNWLFEKLFRELASHALSR